MQIESNKSNNIKYFSSDEDSIIEKEIEKAAKDNFPFFKERNENEIVTDLMEEEDNREVIFKVNTLKKKRGRKPKNPNRKKRFILHHLKIIPQEKSIVIFLILLFLY